MKIIFLKKLNFHAEEFGFYFVGSGELQKVFEQESDTITVEKVPGSRKMGWSRERVSLSCPAPAP